MSGEIRHTPGPWTATPGKHGETIWIGTVDQNVGCVPGYADHPLNVINARLLAAAPDLLAALEEVCGCFDAAEVEGLAFQIASSHADPGSLVDLVRRCLMPAAEAARAAVAKATSAAA